MPESDIPILKKTYDLYKNFYAIRVNVSKQDRYTIFQKCDDCLLDLIEAVISASQLTKERKLPVLEKASLKLSLLRVFVRLMKDIKSIDLKTYSTLEESIDEIGRMLGGWIRSTKE